MDFFIVIFTTIGIFPQDSLDIEPAEKLKLDLTDYKNLSITSIVLTGELIV